MGGQFRSGLPLGRRRARSGAAATAAARCLPLILFPGPSLSLFPHGVFFFFFFFLLSSRRPYNIILVYTAYRKLQAFLSQRCCCTVRVHARVDPAVSPRDLWPRRMINRPESPPPRVRHTHTLARARTRTHQRRRTRFRRYRFGGGTGCSSPSIIIFYVCTPARIVRNVFRQ